MPKDFEKFISQLTETNATLDYFTDFNKIKKNINIFSVLLFNLLHLSFQCIFASWLIL